MTLPTTQALTGKGEAPAKQKRTTATMAAVRQSLLRADAASRPRGRWVQTIQGLRWLWGVAGNSVEG